MIYHPELLSGIGAFVYLRGYLPASNEASSRTTLTYLGVWMSPVAIGDDKRSKKV
jgi:hypothetical protein